MADRQSADRSGADGAGEHDVQQRMAAADHRDLAAHARDLTALARDHASGARSRVMNDRDASYEQDGARPITGAQVVMLAGEQRRRAARERTRGADYRALADEDHQAAALDREHAARDRLHALADRDAFAGPATITRAGLRDLELEIDRCQRTGGPLVVATFGGVVEPAAAGDDPQHDGASREQQASVAAVIRAHLRSYDLIIDLDDGTVLCAMSNLTLTDARQRLSTVATALAPTTTQAASISWRCARWTAHESAEELIARTATYPIEANDTGHAT